MVDLDKLLDLVRAMNDEGVELCRLWSDCDGRARASEDNGRCRLLHRSDARKYRTLELEGVPIRVVTPRMLYEMKKDTVRYKDRIDADKLRRKFGFGDQ